jgi:HEAT repeat protein
MRLDGLSRAAAQSQLETLGDAALPALARALREAQPGTTTEPLAALATFGPAALGPAYDQLYHRNPQHVQRAGALAVAIGPEALPTLLEMLDSTDQRRHLLALTGLGALKQAARPAVPRVLQDLHDAEPLVRWGAAYALGLIGPTDDDQLRELLALAAASDHVIHEQIAPGLVEALLDRIAARPAEADAWRAALRELGQDAVPTLQHIAAGSGPRAKAAAEALSAPR